MKRKKSMQVTLELLLEAVGCKDEFMQAVADNLEFSIQVKNGGWMDLFVESVGGAISVAHYYKQNGDTIPDPDLVFSPDHWNVIEAVVGSGSYYKRAANGRYYPGFTKLANVFAMNIRHQGFVEAAEISDNVIVVSPYNLKERKKKREEQYKKALDGFVLEHEVYDE